MKTAKKISITLTQTALEKRHNSRPLGELLAQAEQILNPHPEWGISTPSNWIVRQAIRAVCEAIIRERQLPCPVTVRLISSAAVDAEPENVIRPTWGLN